MSPMKFCLVPFCETEVCVSALFCISIISLLERSSFLEGSKFDDQLMLKIFSVIALYIGRCMFVAFGCVV